MNILEEREKRIGPERSPDCMCNVILLYLKRYKTKLTYHLLKKLVDTSVLFLWAYVLLFSILI